MKFNKMDTEGKMYVQRLASLPVWNLADEGRIIYTEDTDSFYFCSGLPGTGWVKVTSQSDINTLASIVSDHISDTDPHEATSLPTANRIILRDASGRARVAAPSNVGDIARLQEVNDEATARSNADSAHASLDGGDAVHGASTLANPLSIMSRDPVGQSRVGIPTSSDHIARLQEITNEVSNRDAAIASHNATSSVHNATSYATGGRIILRDGAGRAKVTAPSASDEIAIKSNVDAVQTSLTSHASLTGTNAHGMTDTNTVNRGVVRNGSGDIFCRLLRQEYGSTSSSLNYFLGQVALGAGVDNYARLISTSDLRNLIIGNTVLNYQSWSGIYDGQPVFKYAFTTTSGIIFNYGKWFVRGDSYLSSGFLIGYSNANFVAVASFNSTSLGIGQACTAAPNGTNFVRLGNPIGTQTYIEWVTIGV